MVVSNLIMKTPFRAWRRIRVASGVDRAPSPFSSLILVIASHLTALPVTPLLIKANGFPLVSVHVIPATLWDGPIRWARRCDSVPAT